MKKAILLAALTALAACETAQSPSGATLGATGDTCGASRYGHLRGGPESDVLAVSFNQPVRIVAPRDPVTMDFLPDRLNFALDESGNVVAITCG